MTQDKYAIYLRKSRADAEAEKLGEGETLARHKKILTDLAARKDLYVEKIYQEIESGETIEGRPEMQKLIKDCYAGKYKGIIVIEVSRMSRGNQGDAQVIMDCLKYSNRNDGVLVVTPTKIYDVAHNQDDEEYMEFELFMSRREYKMINKRMGRGKKQAVVEGNYMGSYRPYGYNIIKSKRSRTLIPDEEEAPIVKLIYKWTVNESMTPGAIARRLTTMGVPTYNGDPEWALPTVRQILTNPVYTGKVRWNNRMKVKTMVDGELVTIRQSTSDTDKYMLYDGKHMKHALVSEDMFKAVSKRFHKDKTKSELKLVNPLAGLLVCKKCGKVMVHLSYNKKPNTKPRFTHKQSKFCKVKSAYASDVMDALIYSLKQYIEDFEVKIDNLEDVDEDTVSKQIRVLELEAKKIKKRKARLYEGWEDGDIDHNDFVERKAVHNERLENIKFQIEELEATIPVRDEYEEKVTLLSDTLNIITDDSNDADIKNEYLKRIIDRIEFSRENKDEFILDINLR